MALERMFITGVSPVTLDDVTSGFNIGTNYTTAPQFNNLVGFSEEELRTMLEYYHSEGVLPMTVDEIVAEMKPWYDNYCFASRSYGRETMYNSDMVLYYLNWLIQSGFPPDEMIDKNIRTDYNKLRYLIKTNREVDTSSNLSVIQEIIEKGYTTAVLNDGFSVDEMLKPDNFKSLLYYFGLVTIQGTEFGDVLLGIPNHTVREQMYTYLIEGLVDADIFCLDFYELAGLMKNMAYRGNWKAVFTYIGSELEKQSRIRQFMDGEAHVKTFLLAYLGLTNYYQLMPEYELGKGYTDFYFRPNPRLADIEYAYLLEVKYMKRDEPESRLETLKADAQEQLLRYASDQIVTSTIGGAKLRLITVVFRGWEIVEMVETPTQTDHSF
ncbi:AAA family ATPase, partial [Bacteroides sp. 519]|uniref:PD-(D/E)XK nuclease domain-containing protein n=1 Tax=Bacteroides sp. 519 TaxID=2302937 RepID=UPI0013D567C6